MRPLLLPLLLLAALLLAACTAPAQAQKDKLVQANPADSAIESSVVNEGDEEEEELPDATAGADKAVADVLEDYTEDTFSYAPALSTDQDNVKPGRKKKPGPVPRGKRVGDWYSLRTPKDLLDGLDDGIKKDLSGAGGMCGKKKTKVLTRSGKVKTVVMDACAVPPVPKKRKVVRLAPKRPKAIKPRRPIILDEDDDDGDELRQGLKLKKLKRKKRRHFKAPSAEEEADAAIPRSQMMALTKAEEKKATDEYASMTKRKRMRKSSGVPFPGIPIGVDGEKIGRKGFGGGRGSKFRTGPEDIMPLGSKAAARKSAAAKGPLSLIDPSDLAPLLDGSFMEMESDVIRAFNDASDAIEKEDGGEVAEEALMF